jgi:HAD superfamily hydrolase (TIGR01490 family)
MLGASEKRKGDVPLSTSAAARSSQRRSGAKVAGSAGKQVPAAHGSFAVFDIDGTLIRWQLYHAIADHLVKLGFINPADFAGIKEARMQWKRRAPEASFKTYETALIGAYETALMKLTPAQFGLAVDSVFDEYKDQVYIYTRDLIRQLKKQKYLLFAISGSQSEIVSKIADYYGFDAFLGTVYETAGDKFTGKKIFHAQLKDKALQGLIDRYGLSSKGSIAVGDSKSDIAMLKMVEQPIAFNPEGALFEHASAAGWKIVIERKDKVYELEYRDADATYVLA